ncbi:MAG: hypothetical protein WCK78_17900 [Paludibacter sp.]
MEKEKVFNLSIEHDTANRSWTQKIDDFTVIVDCNKGTVKTFKGDKVIELMCLQDETFTLRDYENLLQTVEQNANELRAYSHG